MLSIEANIKKSAGLGSLKELNIVATLNDKPVDQKTKSPLALAPHSMMS